MRADRDKVGGFLPTTVRVNQLVKHSRVGLAACGVIMMLPLQALAEEGKGSLPQLDAGHFPGQLFWLAVCFPLLYVLMRFLAVPRVQNSLANRKQVLRADLDSAEAANEKAKSLRADYEQALADARAKAQATVNDMALAAAHEEAERRTAQQKELSQRVADAEARIGAFREKALKEARDAAADLAEALVAKLIGFKTP